MIQALATITTNHGSIHCESGVWESEEKAQEELRYFITKSLPMRESFKVVQTLKHITL